MCTKFWLKNSEGKRPLRKPGHRWEDNIKMNLRDIGFGGVDWIHIAQVRDWWQVLVNMVMNLLFP
jgi:ribosome biogenesis protein Nip4